MLIDRDLWRPVTTGEAWRRAFARTRRPPPARPVSCSSRAGSSCSSVSASARGSARPFRAIRLIVASASGASPEHLARELLCCGVQVVLGHDPVAMPHSYASCRVSTRPVSSTSTPERDRQSGESLGAAAARGKAEPRLRQSEAGVLRRNDEIAREHELETPTQREAPDCCDHGLRQLSDGVGRSAADVHEGPVFLGRDVHVVLDVVPGGKRPAGAAQDSDSARAFLEALEGLAQVAEDLGVERVELVRAIKGDPRDPVALLVEDWNLVGVVLHERQHLRHVVVSKAGRLA